MSGSALALQLAIAAMQHATELTLLVNAATAEGRDVTPAEIEAARLKATTAVDSLETAITGV